MRKKKKKKPVKTAREDISHLYPSYIITLSSTTPFLFTPHFSIFHICWYMYVFTRIVIHVNNIIYIYNIVSYICNIPILYIKNRAEATKREKWTAIYGALLLCCTEFLCRTKKPREAAHRRRIERTSFLFSWNRGISWQSWDSSMPTTDPKRVFSLTPSWRENHRLATRNK